VGGGVTARCTLGGAGGPLGGPLAPGPNSTWPPVASSLSNSMARSASAAAPWAPGRWGEGARRQPPPRPHHQHRRHPHHPSARNVHRTGVHGDPSLPSPLPRMIGSTGGTGGAQRRQGERADALAAQTPGISGALSSLAANPHTKHVGVPQGARCGPGLCFKVKGVQPSPKVASPPPLPGCKKLTIHHTVHWNSHLVFSNSGGGLPSCRLLTNPAVAVAVEGVGIRDLRAPELLPSPLVPPPPPSLPPFPYRYPFPYTKAPVGRRRRRQLRGDPT